MMSNFEVETLKTLPPCHPQLVEAIITQIKSQGLFDDFRKSCLSDIDTKPSYLNLKQRVEGYVNNFLSRQQWSSALQRNQLRETLRKDINESGLLKTGLDHLVDQLLYAHAEKSIRPKVRAEIKSFLNLTDASEQQSAACIPHYQMAAPPHYGPPAMPPLPPVPPPPDVTGAMMDTFGNLKPPEPPSPHGSEYSVDMSDSSMVGRDEAPPAIPNSSTVEKFDLNESEVICNDSMDVEEREERNPGQTPLQCSSPEIFEEVSEGGSLGGTPVRDEDASDSEPGQNHTRTDFTGLFKDSRSKTDPAMANDSEVIIDEGTMVFEVSEEYVKTGESAKNDEETGTPIVDDEALSSQGGDLEQTNLTPIMDEVPANDDMEISTDDETQCEDEVQTPREGVQVEDKDADTSEATKEDSSRTKRPEVEEDFHGSLDAELSDTQPPLQIDTEDTEFTVIEKNEIDDSQDADGVAGNPDISQGASDADNRGEPLTTSPEKVDGDECVVDVPQAHDSLEAQKPCIGESDSEKLETKACNDDQGATSLEIKAETQSQHAGSAADLPKDLKHKERRSSSHQKNSSRSDGDRDRRREHKSSHHHMSSSSAKSKKSRDNEQSRSRAKDPVDKREDRKEKEHGRRRERDGKSRDRDRAQHDSKSRSSSHAHRRHSRHHQSRQGDDVRKVQSSTSSGSNKTNRDGNEETRQKSEFERSDGAIPESMGGENSKDGNRSGEDGTAENPDIRSTEVQMTTSQNNVASSSPGESSELTPAMSSSSIATSTSNAKDAIEDDIEFKSEVPPKKSKRKAPKQQDSDRSKVTESKDIRKEAPAVKGRRRRSSAASVTSQQSVELIDQPESPVPSKFGRQRKINPKYEDDGTLSALLFGKQNP